MNTIGTESKVEKSTMETENGKNKLKKIKKAYVKLKTPERANLKQLSKRKFISPKALKQIHALLLFDKGETMTIVMEELALSPQTLLKWRKAFKKDRMDSLLVIQEKKKNEEEKKEEKNDSDLSKSEENDSNVPS